jgi:hypothetical protein
VDVRHGTSVVQFERSEQWKSAYVGSRCGHITNLNPINLEVATAGVVTFPRSGQIEIQNIEKRGNDQEKFDFIFSIDLRDYFPR